MSKPTNLDRLRAAATFYEALYEPGAIGADAREAKTDLGLVNEGIELVMAALARVLRECRVRREFVASLKDPSAAPSSERRARIAKHGLGLARTLREHREGL